MVDDNEVEVKVYYYVQGPEPDVGEKGGVEIESVWYGDWDLTGSLDDGELEDIAQDIIDWNNSAAEAYDEDARWDD